MESVTDTGRRHSFFVHYVVVGLVGSILLAIGAFGVGWLPVNTSLHGNPVVMALRTPGWGGPCPLLCDRRYGVDPAGVAGPGIRRPAWKVRSLPALWWTLAAWSAPLILTPPLFSRDAYAYFTQGEVAYRGSTYDVGLLRNRAGSTMARIRCGRSRPRRTVHSSC